MALSRGYYLFFRGRPALDFLGSAQRGFEALSHGNSGLHEPIGEAIGLALD